MAFFTSLGIEFADLFLARKKQIETLVDAHKTFILVKYDWLLLMLWCICPCCNRHRS